LAWEPASADDPAPGHGYGIPRHSTRFLPTGDETVSSARRRSQGEM